MESENPHLPAQRHLSRRDVVLRKIIKLVGPCTLAPGRNLFVLLVRSIVSQQISTRAAESISARLIAGPCRGRLTPAAILRCTDGELRAAGLSAGKAASLQDLAGHFHSRRIRPSQIPALTDEEVIDRLIPVRGIGRWTAQMALIFGLGRSDILPVDDFGLRAAVRNQYGLPDLPGRAHLEELGEPWRPYRSIATWYLWRSLDNGPKNAVFTAG